MTVTLDEPPNHGLQSDARLKPDVKRRVRMEAVTKSSPKAPSHRLLMVVLTSCPMDSGASSS